MEKKVAAVPQVNIGKVYPDLYQIASELAVSADTAAKEAGLDAKLIELVKLRVSQINGCAYCLRLHSQDAVRLGETSVRLAVLAAWWESQYFSQEERAALQIAEQITLISDFGRFPDRGVAPDESLTEKQIAVVTWVAVVLNSWTRIAISSHYPVSP